MHPTSTHPNPAFDPLDEVVALRSIAIMADGTPEDFEAVIHPDCVNHEAEMEPPDCRGRGPAAVYATARWLRSAYADLHWEVHEVVAERDLVVAHVTMSGRHVGDMVFYDAEGRVADVFPPTGRSFTVTQSHWLRIADGKLIEHWANRDDLGTAQQLEWVPPTPRYLLRMALAKRRARRRAA